MTEYRPPSRLQRKWRKLRRDPVRFFADAKSPVLRKAGLWALAEDYTATELPLVELWQQDANPPNLSVAMIPQTKPEIQYVKKEGAVLGGKSSDGKNTEFQALMSEIENLRTKINHLECIAAQNINNRKIIIHYRSLISKLCLPPLLKIFGWESQFEHSIKTLQKSKLFDENWYITQYEDVRKSKIEPLVHYILFGAFEGYKPNSLFDSQAYLRDNPDVAAAGINPLVHYVQHGSAEGRSPGPGFSAAAYLANNLEARRSRLLPLAHYLKYGARQIAPPATIARPLVPLEKINITDAVRFSEPSAPVDIIVPVYNGYEQTERLLCGLTKRTSKHHRIWLINDASPDTRISLLLADYARKYENVCTLENERNLGFAKTVNIGISNARGHAIILNTDTQVPRDWLPRLILPFDQDNAIASVTPFSNTSSLTGFPRLQTETELPKPLGIDVLDSAIRKIAVDPIEMPSGVGFCMAMNRAAIMAVGDFDGTAYTNGYYEETDWCQRATAAGFRHVLTPNLFVYHEPGSASFTIENRKKYSAKNRRVFEKRWPGYTPKFTAYLKADPARYVRVVAQLLALARCGKKRIVFLDHDRGGGATIYSTSLREKLVNSGDFVMRAVLKNDIAHLTCHVDGCNFSFDTRSVNLRPLLACLDATEVIYNGLHDSSAPIDIVNGLVRYFHDFPAVKLTMLIHDYFAVCPSSSLLNGQGLFCGLPETKACEICFKNMAIANYGETTIAEWRRTWASLMDHADEIRCFSESSRKILANAFTDRQLSKVRVRPHDPPQGLRKVSIRNPDRLHIGILGNMMHHKGSGVVRDLANYLHKNHPEIPITLFGEWFDGTPPPKLEITGPYKPDSLPDMIEDKGANVFLFPSICPETYSFSLSELFEMEFPVVSFALGAQGERVKKYKFGEVLKIDKPTRIIESARRLLKQAVINF